MVLYFMVLYFMVLYFMVLYFIIMPYTSAVDAGSNCERKILLITNHINGGKPALNTMANQG